MLWFRKKDGVTDGAALEEMLKAEPQAACFYVQQPNYYGNIEDGDALGRIVHEAGAKYIMGCNPMALAVMKTPAEYGADIAVGDGQPLGMPLAFGGPYLGFMTATAAMTRKLPGRIVGETADHEGRRAFVLTLQAREQHIRREKASSNVCSNQAWCALTASVYMTAMGADGMAKAAGQCMSKAHYLRDVLKEAGLEPKHNCEFFHEFVTVSPEGGCTDSAHILRALESKGILGGLPLSDREILWCATEMNTREEMDELASAVREALHRECGQKGGVRFMKLVFEKGSAGRRLDLISPCDVPQVSFEKAHIREKQPRLPHMSENEISRHYTELAKRSPRCQRRFLSSGFLYHEVQSQGK